MRILVVDDEELVLEDSVYILKGILPEAEICYTTNANEALQLAEEHFDIAFLDIEMPKMSGMELAVQLQKKQPNINIIFLTAYEKYALEAYKLKASDYLLKPLLVESVKHALGALRYSIEEQVGGNNKIKAVCFGRFTVYQGDHPIVFKREKEKELLAYLIAKRGVSASSSELCDAFWPEEGDAKLRYLWKIISELRKELKDMGLEEIFIDQRENYAVNIENIECDYYDWLDGKRTVADDGEEDFMSQYSEWPEVYRAKLYFDGMN